MRQNTKFHSALRAGVSALFLFFAAGWPSVGGDFAAYADTLTADQAGAIQSAVQTALANVNPSLFGAARQQAIASALAQAMTSAIQTYGTSAIASVTGAAVSAGVPVAQVVAAVLPAASSAAGVSTAVTNVTLGAAAAGASPTQTAEAVIAVSTKCLDTNLADSIGCPVQYAAADIGSGLGNAAAQLSRTNTSGATEIAAVVSNEGTAPMGTSFASSVIQNGGSQQLADAGTKNPTATGAIGGNIGAIGNGPNGPITNLPTCTNPSCT